jgi:hypothetical protein
MGGKGINDPGKNSETNIEGETQDIYRRGEIYCGKRPWLALEMWKRRSQKQRPVTTSSHASHNANNDQII